MISFVWWGERPRFRWGRFPSDRRWPHIYRYVDFGLFDVRKYNPHGGKWVPHHRQEPTITKETP